MVREKKRSKRNVIKTKRDIKEKKKRIKKTNSGNAKENSVKLTVFIFVVFIVTGFLWCGGSISPR